MTGDRRGARHAAVYRWLLRVYPRTFRDDFGEAALAAFGDLHRAAARDGGWGALARLWTATVPRVLLGGVSERAAEARRALLGSRTAAAEGPSGPPYGWAVLAGTGVFALYAATLAPTTAYWDASEYIATAHIVGVPHPPGNPLFVVLARSWELLLAPLGLSVAVRINLFSAFMSAAAHGLWFLTIHHVLGSFARSRAFRLVGAAVAVLVSATAFTVWSQSNVNEKVYTVSLLTIALLSWLAIRWQAAAGRPGRDKLLVLMAFVLALSVGNHLMAFLAAPALVVFVLLVEPGTFRSRRLYPWLALAGVAGLSVHLFLPVRAALQPLVNEGAPLCDSIGSALASVLSYGRAGCEALSESLNRNQYQKPPLWDRQAPLTEQLANYLQYFDWQWSRGLGGTQALFSGLRAPFTALFTGLGVWGAMEHHRRDRRTFWYMAVLFATLSVALTVYLNFEYGYSMPGPEGMPVEREVRERDYFFIVSFSIWGLWAGVGIAAVWLRLSEAASRRRLLPAAPILALAGVPLLFNAGWADRSDDYAARDWAHNLLESVEPYGVLFTVGDNDTFPLWYLQEVEGIRRDVTVVVTSYLNTPWYAKQVRDVSRPCERPGQADERPTRVVCQRDYRPGPRAVYAARSPERGAERGGLGDGAARDTEPDAAALGDAELTIRELDLTVDEDGRALLSLPAPVEKPDLPIMQLDDETIDRIATSFARLEQDVSVDLGAIRPVISAGTIIEPWHQYALAIVDTAFSDDRPVYWAASRGPPDSLGLGPYLVRQGVAFKLHKGPLPGLPAGLRSSGQPETEIPVEDIAALPVDSPAGRWLDVPRTEVLLNDVFLHRGGLPEWSHWPDPATAYTPAQYAYAYLSLSHARYQAGDLEAKDRYEAIGLDWVELAR